MKIKAIFDPLKKKESLKVFFLALTIIAGVYFIFSIGFALLSIKPFPQGKIMDIIIFSGFKAFSTFFLIDWILLALFPLVGGLLFANYSYYKCKTSTAGKTGLGLGLIAATCPACILPILGFTAAITFLTKISIYIKIGALLLLVGATVYVANKEKKCLPEKKG